MRIALLLMLVVATVASADERSKKLPSISDQATGLTVSVNADRTLVASETKTGKIVWKSNAIQPPGKANAAQVVVRNLSIKNGVLIVDYGQRHS